MQQLNKQKYLKGKELRKVTELNAHMHKAESMDKLAWIIIALCIILFVIFGGY
jgi:hypothetical protein